MQSVIAIWSPQTAELDSIAELCLSLSPQVAYVEHKIFIEIGRCQKILPQSQAIEILLTWLREWGIQAQLAIAPTSAVALAFVKYKTKQIEALPIEALEDLFDPYKTHKLPVKAMRALGIKTMSDFFSLPKEKLLVRFGHECLWVAQQRHSHFDRPWPYFRLTEKVTEKIELDAIGVVQNIEAIAFLLKNILSKAAQRLLARHRQFLAFKITFHLSAFSKTPIREFYFQLPAGQSNASDLASLAREKIDRELASRPLEDQLESIHLSVEQEAILQETHRELFSNALERKEKWSNLYARLRQRLGSDNAFYASLRPRILPEASWQRSSKFDGQMVPTPERPTRILSKPILLYRKAETLVDEQGSSWVIISISEVERLQAEWWLQGFKREYYRVKTNDVTLWVFRQENNLYLHGWFD